MATYVPDFSNEITRIVLTTRNDNPSVEDYDSLALPEWKRCKEIEAAAKQANRPLTVEELADITRRVLTILRVKQVPETEIRERVDEAFERCRAGGVAVDRARIESLLHG
jgi:hypothetical protein